MASLKGFGRKRKGFEKKKCVIWRKNNGEGKKIREEESTWKENDRKIGELKKLEEKKQESCNKKSVVLVGKRKKNRRNTTEI